MKQASALVLALLAAAVSLPAIAQQKATAEGAAVIASALASADSGTAKFVIDETERAALQRLATEFTLSRKAVSDGGRLEQEVLILTTWTEWYVNAIQSIRDLEAGGPTASTTAAIETAATAVQGAGLNYVARLR